MLIKIKKLRDNAIIPKYATSGSGCFDIHTTNPGIVHCNNPLVCHTGLSFEIPHGHLMFVFSRSGHGFKNDVRLSNCVGIIDSDYRGELIVKLKHDTEGPALHVKYGDRIAQAVVMPYEQVTFLEVDHLSSTDRGEGGFGSTGVAAESEGGHCD